MPAPCEKGLLKQYVELMNHCGTMLHELEFMTAHACEAARPRMHTIELNPVN